MLVKHITVIASPNFLGAKSLTLREQQYLASR